jgi:hypothetical protein
MQAVVKVIIQALIPYVVDGLKYLYRQLTLKKMREARKKKAYDRLRSYENAQTDQEVEDAFENRT